MFKLIKLLLLFIFLIFLGYWSLIEFPSFLFSHKYKNANLTVYSDKPIPSNIEEITDEVLMRLNKSSLFNKDRTYSIYISNDMWR
tara:strand:- start:1113 stop:1367 length:255 start_codon:yes stop_codon:yes gene_type:complete